MNKPRIILLVIGLMIFLSGLSFFLAKTLKPRGAGLLVETTPTATVFIAGAEVGRTPYETVGKPGEVVVKLIPESISTPLVPYEVRINLVSGIKTIIKREFASSDEASSGEIISFEKVGGSETSLAIVSIPDSAQISIDGQIRGFTPYKTSSLTAGEHQLKISAPGYIERTISPRTAPGYKLTVVVKLAPSGEVAANKEEATPTPTPPEKKMLVEILSTPTGFLRVRSEPSSLGSEVGQVKPGSKYPLIDTDQKTGWFKIEYETGSFGWVSSQYAKKVEAGSTPSPSPSVKTTAAPTPKATATPR